MVCKEYFIKYFFVYILLTKYKNTLVFSTVIVLKESDAISVERDALCVINITRIVLSQFTLVSMHSNNLLIKNHFYGT